MKMRPQLKGGRVKPAAVTQISRAIVLARFAEQVILVSPPSAGNLPLK